MCFSGVELSCADTVLLVSLISGQLLVIECFANLAALLHVACCSRLTFLLIDGRSHTFVSINHITIGHYNLTASLSRYNIGSTVECECGDGLGTEEQRVKGKQWWTFCL